MEHQKYHWSHAKHFVLFILPCLCTPLLISTGPIFDYRLLPSLKTWLCPPSFTFPIHRPMSRIMSIFQNKSQNHICFTWNCCRQPQIYSLQGVLLPSFTQNDQSKRLKVFTPRFIPGRRKIKQQPSLSDEHKCKSVRPGVSLFLWVKINAFIASGVFIKKGSTGAETFCWSWQGKSAVPAL